MERMIPFHKYMKKKKDISWLPSWFCLLLEFFNWDHLQFQKITCKVQRKSHCHDVLSLFGKLILTFNRDECGVMLLLSKLYFIWLGLQNNLILLSRLLSKTHIPLKPPLHPWKEVYGHQMVLVSTPDCAPFGAFLSTGVGSTDYCNKQRTMTKVKWQWQWHQQWKAWLQWKSIADVWWWW